MGKTDDTEKIRRLRAQGFNVARLGRCWRVTGHGIDVLVADLDLRVAVPLRRHPAPTMRRE